MDLTEQPQIETSRPPRNKWLARIARILGLIMFGYALLIGVLILNENNLVYPAMKYPRGDWQPAFEFEEVTYISADGTKLVGWYLPFEGATENALICHGNAENVALTAEAYGLKFQSCLNANVFIVDYRGYGKSEGEPFEAGVLEDAEAALDWLCDRAQCEPDEVIIAGHSIGGGPAVHLASSKGAKALFLQRTFASLVEPAASRFWFVPVDYIMRNRFPSAERIANCQIPLHQSHGNADTLVPYESGQRLHAASPAKLKRFYLNANRGHWDPLPLDYWADVQAFKGEVNQQLESDAEEQVEEPALSSQ